MYWPTAAAKQIDIPSIGDNYSVQGVRSSKRGNFFVWFTRDTLAVWDVRVSFLHPGDLERKLTCSQLWFRLLLFGLKRVLRDGARISM